MANAGSPVVVKKPSKTRSAVTVDNFRKFKPRVLGPSQNRIGTRNMRVQKPSKRLTLNRLIKVKPKPPKPEPKSPESKPLPPEPKSIQVKKPVKPPPPKIQQKNMVAQPPKRTLLRQQLSELRQRAIKRGKVSRAREQDRAVVKAQIVAKSSRKTIGSKKIESLKNIGVGRALIIVAAGPSVLEVDFEPIKNHPKIDFMCINSPKVKSIWPTKFWAFCDHTQQRANIDTWNRFDGIIINSPNVKARRPNQVIIRTRPGKGFSTDVTKGYHIGRSSTYANMQVAHYMSYRKVYLFGVDMAEVDGKLHHYGQNPDVPNERRKSRFPAEAQHYMWAAQNLSEESRKRFVFCSSYNPWPFLKYFEHWDHKTAVERILEDVNG